MDELLQVVLICVLVLYLSGFRFSISRTGYNQLANNVVTSTGEEQAGRLAEERAVFPGEAGFFKLFQQQNSPVGQQADPCVQPSEVTSPSIFDGLPPLLPPRPPGTPPV